MHQNTTPPDRREGSTGKGHKTPWANDSDSAEYKKMQSGRSGKQAEKKDVSPSLHTKTTNQFGQGAKPQGQRLWRWSKSSTEGTRMSADRQKRSGDMSPECHRFGRNFKATKSLNYKTLW
jgi:hypothetical protein